MSGPQIVKKCLQDGYANCTPKCNSSEHTFTLITALTQDRPQEEILAWIARHCNAPGRSRDTYGRSVLHMAASLGMVDICNWLLTYKGANLNGRDKESCYTALHRCIVYGQLRTAIFFLKQGANLALTDYNGLTALDLLVMDKPLNLNYSKSAPLETYVWGNNSNYNLGTGDNSSRSSPDLIESFRKQNISIKKVAFQKFHTGFLSSTGACTDIALGVDHSLFLAQSGVVFSCGHNTYHQLGQQPPPSRLLAPAPVQGPKKPAKGVAAARYHSAFWTEDSVFTWGLNAGQLGHLKGEKTVILPRLVTGYEMKDSKITQVALSDGSTVICTNKGDIIALHGYTSKKIGHKQFGIEKIEVSGGHLDPAVDPGDKDKEIDFKLVAGGGSPLHIYVLRQGQVLVWTEGKEKNFLSCTLSVSKPQPTIIDISAFRNGCLLVSKDGEVWESCIAQFNAQNSSVPAKRATSPVQDRFVPAARTKSMKETCVSLKVKRIPGIHRAVFATSDPKGKTFCVLQVSPSEALTEVPEITKSSMTKDMTDLYNQMSECDDVHDVVCVVQGVRFPAHSAVIAAGADLLGKKLKCLEDETVPAILEIDNVDPVIFRQLLEYIYTKSCPLLQEGPCAIAINVPDSNDKDVDSKIAITENTKKDELTLELDEDPATVSAYAVYERNRKKKAKELKKPSENENAEKKRNPLALFQEAGKKLGVYGIGKIVDCFRYDDGVIYKRSNPVIGQLDFNLQNLMFLADVTLVAEDGVEFYAHKSILVARSEYFNAMLTSGWIESKEENSLNLMIKSCYLEAILEYLYRDQCKTLSQSDDTEFISNLLVHADQLLLVRLRELCENELAKLITLKNVAEMLEFTFVYMAEQLKRSCLQFVVLNLGCLLESQALNNLEDEVLEALDHYYRETNNKVASRRITPIQGYPTNKDIESEYDSNPLTFDQLLQQEDSVLASGKPRTRRNSSGEKKKSPKLRNRNSSIRLSGSSIGTNSGSEDEDSISQGLILKNYQIAIIIPILKYHIFNPLRLKKIQSS